MRKIGKQTKIIFFSKALSFSEKIHILATNLHQITMKQFVLSAYVFQLFITLIISGGVAKTQAGNLSLFSKKYMFVAYFSEPQQVDIRTEIYAISLSESHGKLFCIEKSEHLFSSVKEFKKLKHKNKITMLIISNNETIFNERIQPNCIVLSAFTRVLRI